MQNMNWAPLLPIIFLSVMIAVIQLADVFRREQGSSPAYGLSLFATLALTLWFAVQAASGETHYVFSNMAVFDPMAQVLSSFCALATLVTFVYTAATWLTARCSTASSTSSRCSRCWARS